jgi:RNA polymerase sigma-70 factor (ECF subfamily)
MSTVCEAPRPAGEPGRTIVPERAADHIDRLYGLALALCGSPHLAEDLVQETYARLMTRPRRIRGGEDFPYLARIVRNLLYDHYRKAGRADWADFELAEAEIDRRDENDPESAARTSELVALIAELPVAQREAVAAVDLAGMSYREAAWALRVPIGTVMSRLARGRARLAAHLAGDLRPGG